MINRKERGEPGKIYHVRNIIGRENLITSGQTNEIAHALWYSFSCKSFMVLVQLQKLYGRQNVTRQHYATLLGSMASYGEHTQTRTFENHALLALTLAN